MGAGLLHFLRFRSHALTSSYNQITRGFSNCFNLVQRIKNFSNKRVKEILVPYLNVVLRNSYFAVAHQEYALIAMLGESAAWRSGSERRFYDDHDRKVDGSPPNLDSLLRPWIRCFTMIISAWWSLASSKL